MSWIIPICLFPVLGALIYVFIVGNFSGFGLKVKLGRRIGETEGKLYTDEETENALKKVPASVSGLCVII